MGYRMAGHTLSRPLVSAGLRWPLLLGTALVFGCALGAVAAFSAGDRSAVAQVLREYFKSVESADELCVNVSSVIWSIVRWPLLVILFGLSRVGLAAIPALIFLRAFLLAHAVAVFVKLFAFDGVVAALVLFGVPAFLVLPLLFALGCDGLALSAGNVRGAESWLTKKNFPVLLGVVAVCVAAIFLQCTVLPVVLTAVCNQFYL